MPLDSGEIFAGFRIIRLLGSGGMGEGGGGALAGRYHLGLQALLHVAEDHAVPLADAGIGKQVLGHFGLQRRR